MLKCAEVFLVDVSQMMVLRHNLGELGVGYVKLHFISHIVYRRGREGVGIGIWGKGGSLEGMECGI